MRVVGWEVCELRGDEEMRVHGGGDKCGRWRHLGDGGGGVVGGELAGDRVRDGMSSYHDQAQPIPMKSQTSKMSSLCLRL